MIGSSRAGGYEGVLDAVFRCSSSKLVYDKHNVYGVRDVCMNGGWDKDVCRGDWEII